MRLILTLLFACSVAGLTSCGFLSGPGDCGCSAYYEIPKHGGEIQVQFRIVTAETVGGYTNCGYKDIPTKVAKATLRGVPMREITKGPNEYLYAAPADFNPAVDEVVIEIRGNEYVSKKDSVKRIDDSMWFTLALN